MPFLYPYRAYAGTAKYIETGMSPRALTMPFGGDDMIQPARFKGVRDWLDEHIWSTGARDIPALRWVFNAGVVRLPSPKPCRRSTRTPPSTAT